MMKRRPILVMGFVGLWLVSVERGSPAAPAKDSPEDIVATALDALNHDRPDEYVKAMHPEALKQFRTATLEIVAHAKTGQVPPLFQGVKDIPELKKLSETQLLTSYLRGMIPANPKAKRALSKTKIEVLGHVAEGKETTHVVYRSKLEIDGAKLEKLNVSSLRKDGTAWKLLLPSEIEGAVAMVKQQVAGKFTLPDLQSSRVQPLGQLVEDGGTIQVVYRFITPIGDSSFRKVAALSVNKDTPEWAAVREGRTAEITKLIKQRNGIR
jgi:hypothetical protein